MSQLEFVAFDMDGTLLNSGGFGVAAIVKAFDKLISAGLIKELTTAPADSHIRAQIGKPPHEFYQSLLPEADKPAHKDLHHWASIYEREFLRDGTGQLFEGARDVLDGLKAHGLKLLLVSNCGEVYMEAVVEAFNLDELLDYRSPAGRSPDVSKSGELIRGMKELGLQRGVMVGDRIHDFDAANEARIGFIGCTYGYGHESEFDGVDCLIHDIRELPMAL
ncbi:MAG: HAD family hydrolase [Planctomycetota bacterium]|jgi:phosphoglycolate phosphatase-like HAD superfamily hydrolase